MIRAADIKNAYRYNDFYQAYNSKSKIAIFSNEREFKQSEKEIKDEILILIHMIQEDLEVQIHVKEVFGCIQPYTAVYSHIQPYILCLDHFISCL